MQSEREDKSWNVPARWTPRAPAIALSDLRPQKMETLMLSFSYPVVRKLTPSVTSEELGFIRLLPVLLVLKYHQQKEKGKVGLVLGLCFISSLILFIDSLICHPL